MPLDFRTLFGFGKKANRRARPRASIGLRLETLEDRCVPAVLHVGPHEQYHTISAAVTASHNGDLIRIDSGTYQEQVTINKSIELEGSGSSTVILAPTGLGSPTAANPDAVVRVTGSGTSVAISDLTIEGAAGGTANLLYGVRVDGNAFADIENTTVANIIDSSNTGFGVAIDVGNASDGADGTGAQVGYALIANDTISNYQRAGIVISNTGSAAAVLNSTIAGGSASVVSSVTGVEVSEGAVALIANNTISGNKNLSTGEGIGLFSPGMLQLPSHGCDPWLFSVTTTIINNKITGNDYGIYGSEVTATPTASNPWYQVPSAEVGCNQISGNTYVGIEFDNSSNLNIDNNHISGNGSDNTADGGIYLYQTTNSTISDNHVHKNDGSGIYVDAGSTGNTLLNNHLHGNLYDTTAGNADAVDLSTGKGTAGTANTWIGNHGKTFIDNSGETLFGPDDHHGCY